MGIEKEGIILSQPAFKSLTFRYIFVHSGNNAVFLKFIK
jgi:hypothetical protein